jgi:hypothetical protein
MPMSTLDRVLAFAKKILALVNLRVINMTGKNYLKRKEEPIPMKLPKIYKNDGATSNILNILIQSLLVTFQKFLWLKKLFSAQTGHVFFR